jgi:nitroimidazol reductase NimA-like FMN-containing flavoprotein (pyridoxamine 5'-phosphate oxidase superfamily)
MIEDIEEKKQALQLIMTHYSDKSDWAFTNDMVNAISVFKLEVKNMACKEHF